MEKLSEFVDAASNGVAPFFNTVGMFKCGPSRKE